MRTHTLTLKQARFCDEYVVSGNAADAARRAGYPGQSARQVGFENLTKPDIKAAIEGRRRIFEKRLELRREDVIQAILGAIQTAQQQGNPATMIRGWAEIAKITGLDKPEAPRKRPLSPNAETLRRHFESLPTSELLEIAAGRAAVSFRDVARIAPAVISG